MSRKGNNRLRTLVAAIAAASASGPLLAGDLLGRVTDAGLEAGLSGVLVEVAGTNRRTTTDQNGNFRVRDLAEGEYEVRLSYPGAKEQVGRVRVAATGTARFDAKLQPQRGIDEVLVVGQRASQASAISQQRYADEIASYLTRDAIGQFPDQNVTEAVRRLPGVSVQNDQGEGRFIVLRGMDPNLNSASLNGVRITAPESDIRAVALDVVPAELVDSIQFQKSLIPEMDGDVIGGSIDIKTPSALDRDGPFVSVTGTGSYNDLVDEWSPKFGLDASTMVSDRLGVAFGISYFERQLGSDNLEAEDWTEEDGVVYAESYEMRDYLIERTRIGGTLGLDFLLSDSTRLFARGVYSEFEDFEKRAATEFDFGDAVPVAGDGATAGFALSGDEELSVTRSFKDRTETQQIASLLLGGETFSGPWSFDYEVSTMYAQEDEDDTFDTTDFETTFEAGELALQQTNTGSDKPRIVIDPANLADFQDASRYEFDGLEAADGFAEDKENGLRFDVARKLAAGDADLEVKGGLRARWREKSYDLGSRIYDGYDGAGDFLLSDVATTVDYGLGPIGPTGSRGAIRGVLGDLSDFEFNLAETRFGNAAASYEVDEDILAGYLQGRYESGPLTLIGGVRVESTDNQVKGNRVELIEEGATYEGEVLARDTTFITPVSFDKSDTQYLPSLNLRFEAREDVVLRAAAYASLFRPNMQDLAPRFAIEQNDEDDREGEFGNPDLDPYSAWNFDASGEWYFADNAVLQGGVFHKRIEDFIFRRVLEDVDFNGVLVDEGVIPLNGETADVTGLELNYQHALSDLPAPFDGLILGANYTYVDSEADLGDRSTELPGTSENVLNLILGYEAGPVSLRLAWVYRDEYLDELSGDGESDRFVQDHESLDFSARYTVSDSIQLFFEMANILDEPYVAVARTPLGDRVLQYEEYSFTLNAGLKATF